MDSQFDQALTIYEELEGLGQQHGNRRMVLASLVARTTIQAVPSAIYDPERAGLMGEQALSLARELGNQEAEAQILLILSLVCHFTGRQAEAIDFGERSLAVARKLGLREQTARSLNDLGGLVYLYGGRIRQAIAALQEASEMWRELGSKPMLADSLSGSCIAHLYAGEYDSAIALSEQAYEISQAIGNLWGQSYSLWAIGDAFRERGEYSRAIAASEECIRLGKQAGFVASQMYTPVRLAAAYGDLGAFERAFELVAPILGIEEKDSIGNTLLALGGQARLQVLAGDLAQAELALRRAKKSFLGEASAIFGLPTFSAEAELALHRGQYERAAAVTASLLARLEQYGMRSRLPEALYLQGRALLGLGQEEAARTSLEDARAEAHALGSRRTLWRILYTLSQLEREPSKAQELQQEARHVIAYIADHIDQESLRHSFLALADVRAAVGSA